MRYDTLMDKTEGIVLRSQDYKERHRLITLFTPQGLISLIVKSISRKNTRLLSLTTPFCHGEYHFRRGQSELLRFLDGTILDDHFHLRQSLASLQTAGALANAILTSQMASKPAPALFALYRSFHNQVPHFSDPTILLASFQLKLLKHEGLFAIDAPCETLPFSPTEWDTILSLDAVQQFSALRNLNVPPPLAQKIQTLFRLSL